MLSSGHITSRTSNKRHSITLLKTTDATCAQIFCCGTSCKKKTKGGNWLAQSYMYLENGHENWGKHRYTHTFNGPLSRTTRVGRYQKGKTNLDFTEAGDSEWQWNPLGHMQVCTLLQTDKHASTPPLSVLQAGCPSCRPTNSVKALKAKGKHR